MLGFKRDRVSLFRLPRLTFAAGIILLASNQMSLSDELGRKSILIFLFIYGVYFTKKDFFFLMLKLKSVKSEVDLNAVCPLSAVLHVFLALFIKEF